MIDRFELRRRQDGLVYRFERDGVDAFKRVEGDYWIMRHDSFGWVAWDRQALEVQGRPWNVAAAFDEDGPPEGEWVSKKGDKSYVYALLYVP